MNAQQIVGFTIIIWLLGLTIVITALIYYVTYVFTLLMGTPGTSLNTTGTTMPLYCEIGTVKFLYSPTCPYCERQLTDGSLEQLESFGIDLVKIDLSLANESVPYVPAWRYNNTEVYGWKPIGELKEMFGCE